MLVPAEQLPVTVKLTELLFAPPTLTITCAAPADRELGTVAAIELADQEVTVACTPPMLTVLVP